MKKLILFVLALGFLFQMNAFGQTRMDGKNFSLGVEFGDFPGICSKIWVTDTNAIAMGVGFGSYTRVHADYLWHNFDIFKVDSGRLPMYYGFGGIINTGVGNTATFGVRGVFGTSYIFNNNNFDLFFELCPTLRLYADSGLYLSGAVGVRFYFL